MYSVTATTPPLGLLNVRVNPQCWYQAQLTCITSSTATSCKLQQTVIMYTVMDQGGRAAGGEAHVHGSGSV
jgi:hypothetical protein